MRRNPSLEFHGLRLAAAMMLLFMLCHCRFMPQVNAQHMPPEELIRTLGPPARMDFDKTVFGFKGVWVKGAQEYRYYFVDRRGKVGHHSYFYKNQSWLTESTSYYVRPLTLLNFRNPGDRKKIEDHEASNPWLEPSGQ